MKNRCITLHILCLLLHTFVVTFPHFAESNCPSRSEAEVAPYIAGEMPGVGAGRIAELLELSDCMADRSQEKTWATHYSLAQYQNINFAGGAANLANNRRFGYPGGEVSGGYGQYALVQAQPYRDWEIHSREIATKTYEYMLQLMFGQFGGNFAQFFPPRIQDCGKPRIYHSTHAELKLITRLMRQGLRVGDPVIIAVSRHMCNRCVPIMAHLARNGRRKVVVGSPRKGKKVQQLRQPEFILFREDGSFERFSREGVADNSQYKCERYQFSGQVPNGVDNYYPPTNVGRMAAGIGKLNMNSLAESGMKETEVSSRACETEEVDDGPGSECISFIRSDLPKAVDCPKTKTLTGIHGAFGILNAQNPVVVLKNIGAFCDVNTKVDAMGPSGELPFERKCPRGFQVVGLYGRFGLLVDKIGVICRRWYDGEERRSSLAGPSNGGSAQEKECEVGAAGNSIRLWVDEAIDGLGMCRR